MLFGNSALDARPFSFTGQPTPKPSYSDAQIVASFAGPLKIPGLITRNAPEPVSRLSADDRSQRQHAVGADADRARARRRFLADAATRWDAPIQLRRSGQRPSFHRQRDSRGRGSARRRRRCSATTRCRTSTATAASTTRRRCSTTRHQDAGQVRFSQSVPGSTNQLFGNLALQRTTTDAGNVFGFTDSSRASGVDTTVNWSHRFSQLLSLRLRYQFTRLTDSVDAVLREPHQRLRRRRHHRQQSGSDQLGPAAAAVLERHRRPRQRAGRVEQQQHARRAAPRSCRRAAATT